MIAELEEDGMEIIEVDMEQFSALVDRFMNGLQAYMEKKLLIGKQISHRGKLRC